MWGHQIVRLSLIYGSSGCSYQHEYTGKLKAVIIMFMAAGSYWHWSCLWAVCLCASINYLKPLWPCDTIWYLRSWSTLVQVLACCLLAPSHYLSQCWLIMKGVHWHSPERNFTKKLFLHLPGGNELSLTNVLILYLLCHSCVCSVVWYLSKRARHTPLPDGSG